MSEKFPTLKDDYLSLLKDPRPLVDMGLVHDSSAIQSDRPFAGKDIDRAWAQLRLESTVMAAIDKDEPLDISSNLRKEIIEGEGSQQFALDENSKDLLAALELLELQFPIPYLVADFPLAYPFNAATLPRPNSNSPIGALVLINRGLTDMIWLAAKLFSIGINIQVMNGEETISAHESLPINKEDIADWLARIVLAYLRDKNAHFAGRLLPSFGAARTTFAALLTNECTKFVLAHEFSHIIAGHLTNDASVPGADDPDGYLIYKVLEHIFLDLSEKTSGVIRIIGRSTEHITRKWYQEIDADLLGLKILFACIASREGQKVSIEARNPLFEFIAAAPFLLLALEELITEVEKARNGHRNTIFLTTHPPSGLRTEFVKRTYNAWGFPQLPHVANELVNWFSGIQEQVVETVLKLTLKGSP